jgi:hypothetical protein
MVAVATICASTAACLPPPYEAEPTSVYGWQQRQERIERDAARQRAQCLAETKRQPVSGACQSGRSVSRNPRQCDGSELGLHSQVLETYPDGSCLISWSDF